MSVSNRQVSELAAVAAGDYEGNKQRALRRCSHVALMWAEEAADLLLQDRPLTELEGVGNWLQDILKGWIEEPPEIPEPPPVRTDFLTYAEALSFLRDRPDWRGRLRGDLQMHTIYSDGQATVSEMALIGPVPRLPLYRDPPITPKG